MKFSAILLWLLISSNALLFGEETLKIGVTAGPHMEILEHIKPIAKKQGLTLKIIEFNDFILPNRALVEGDLDANSYQHQPFLDEQVKERGYPLVSVGKTILLPLGVYTKKKDISCLADLKPKAKVAIPNDPTNGGRALLLLAKEGVIKLKPDAGITPSRLDIAENPKKLKFVELEAPQIPRSLSDVDIGIINTDWALLAGLDPEKDTIAHEGMDSPYANIVVVRTENKDSPAVKHFLEIYQTDDTKAFIKSTFGNAIKPAW
jgi:D-methionine transport system substrate-binding protein